MPLEEDVQVFIEWANNLGYPLENLPNNEALKSIFKSRQSALFFKMIEHVRPRQKVLEIRQNVLLSKMKTLNEQVITINSRNFLPRQMQRYLKIQDLRKEQAEYDTKVRKAKEQSNKNSVKMKNLQQSRLNHTRNELNIKVNILDLKLESLNEDLNNEMKDSKKIQSIMPVKQNASNSDETLVVKAINEAFRELEDFYTISVTNSNGTLIKNAKDELWNKLKQIFVNIPNSKLWNVIIRLKDQQLQDIKTMSNKTINNKHQQLAKQHSCLPTSFEMEKMKAISSLITIMLKFLSTQKEYEKLNSKFINAYGNFTDSVQSKIGLYSTELQTNKKLSVDDIESILSDYIVQYNTRSYNEGQVNFLLNEIENIQRNVNDGKNRSKNNEITMNALKQMYSDITLTVQRVQQEIVQLNQIKEKIVYSKTLLQYLLSEIKQNQSKTMLDSESFNMSGNVLCSTKLDFDCTTISNMTSRNDCTIMSIQSNNSIVGGGFGFINHNLPQHSMELTTFMETPISKLHFMAKECYPYLLPNPLVTDSTEFLSMIQFYPGILLTTDGSLKHIQSKIDWYMKLKEISTELRNDKIELIEVDEKDFKEKFKQQHEEITEILDNIDVTAIKTKRTLSKAKKYYNFILNNTLKNYIPHTRLFNNQTYVDYDNEYIMFYRMTANSKLN